MYVVDNIVSKQSIKLDGNAEIQDLAFPSTIDPNTPFEVSYNAINLRDISQRLWGNIIDADSGRIVPGSNWETDVPAGGVYFSVASFTGITNTFNGAAVIGHIEKGKAAWPMLIPIGGIIAMIGIAQW